MLRKSWCRLTRPLFHFLFGDPAAPPLLRRARSGWILHDEEGRAHRVPEPPAIATPKADDRFGKDLWTVIAITLGIVILNGITWNWLWPELKPLPNTKIVVAPIQSAVFLVCVILAIVLRRVLSGPTRAKRPKPPPHPVIANLRGWRRFRYHALKIVLSSPMRTGSDWLILGLVFVFLAIAPLSALWELRDMVAVYPLLPVRLAFGLTFVFCLVLVPPILAWTILTLLYWPCARRYGWRETDADGHDETARRAGPPEDPR